LGSWAAACSSACLRFRHFLQVDQRDAAVHLGMDQRRVKLVGLCEFGLRFIQQLLIHQGGAKVVQLGGFRLLGWGNVRATGSCGDTQCGEEYKAREGAARR
jgi:hypothetical protein